MNPIQEKRELRATSLALGCAAFACTFYVAVDHQWDPRTKWTTSLLFALLSAGSFASANHEAGGVAQTRGISLRGLRLVSAMVLVAVYLAATWVLLDDPLQSWGFLCFLGIAFIHVLLPTLFWNGVTAYADALAYGNHKNVPGAVYQVSGVRGTKTPPRPPRPKFKLKLPFVVPKRQPQAKKSKAAKVSSAADRAKELGMWD